MSSFFTCKSNHWWRKLIQKEKLFFHHLSFEWNYVMAPIFQIIHTWNKTLNPGISGGLERRSEVKSLLQSLLTFSHLTSKGKEAPGTSYIWCELDERKLEQYTCSNKFSIVFTLFLCYYMMIVNNFFDILKFFDLLNFYWRLIYDVILGF